MMSALTRIPSLAASLTALNASLAECILPSAFRLLSESD